MAFSFDLPAPVLGALDRLWAAGFPSYAVGGCIRDRLLGREPGDWDIATAAKPEETMAVFAGESVTPTGLRHGTVTVTLEQMPLEVTTFRLDGAYSDGRHPDQVTFTDRLPDDLARRDFTINAMAYSPQSGLVDCFAGRQDLEARLLRAVGDPDRRFQEDALRVLRGVRFAAQLDFMVEPITAAALLRNGERLRQVAAERLLTEWRRLLTGPAAARALTAFRPVAEVLFPSLISLSPVQWTRSLDALDGLPADFPLRQAALLSQTDLSLSETGAVLQALRLDTAGRRRTLRFLEELRRPAPVDRPACLRLAGRTGSWKDAKWAVTGRATLFPKDPSPAAALDLLQTLEAEGACFTLDRLAVHGGDLLALGVPQGPQMGRLLAWLLDAVVDGQCPNQRDALLYMARRIYAQRIQMEHQNIT